MPVYEYECLACNEITEIWQGLADAPLANCPLCQGKVKKLISMSSFTLKGGGWFADGYSNKSSPCKKSGCTAPSSPSECPKAKSSDCGSC